LRLGPARRRPSLLALDRIDPGPLVSIQIFVFITPTTHNICLYY
jgi:hypothetical protein